MPLAISQAEVIEVMGSGKGPSCEDLAAFGLNNQAAGVEIGKYDCFVSEWYQNEFCQNPASSSVPVNYYY